MIENVSLPLSSRVGFLNCINLYFMGWSSKDKQESIYKKSNPYSKKTQQKHNKKPANGCNSQGEGGEVHWMARDGLDGAVFLE